MKMKKLLAGASLACLSALSLASCSGSSRNTQTPTGGLDLSGNVATALDGKLSMSKSTYYNRLRYNASNIVTTKIKTALYSKELATVKAVFANENYNDLTSEQQALLVPTKDDNKLFELGGHDLTDEEGVTNYAYIRNELVETLNQQLSSAVYGSANADTIDEMEEKDKNEKIQEFIVKEARLGYTFTASDFAYTMPTDDSNIIRFTNIHEEKFLKVLEDYMLTQAGYLSAQNALYQIADEQYINNYDDEEGADKTKNSNYIYDDEDDYLTTSYESTYQTYGTYHAIVIQFDSLAIAKEYTKGVTFSTTDTIEEVLTKYIQIYNKYYSYKQVTNENDERFTYTVSKDNNDFDDLSDSIKSLIQDTLDEDEIANQYLSEPRNIDNKYVLAVRYNTEYDETSTKDGALKSEDVEWDDLSDARKSTLTTRIKYTTLESKRTSYVNTNFESMVYTRSNNDDETDDIFIYDPIFEYKFESSYADQYELIDSDSFDNDKILSIKLDDGSTYTYTTQEFYDEASKQYGATTIYNYFSLEYAYSYYDEYVDSDTHDDNSDALDDAISEFKNNNNTSYPKAIGLENYLLLAYGYTTKEDVLKYYYDAATCQSEYLSKAVFSEWGTKNEDGTYSVTSGLESKGILYNILNTGNENYSDIMSINLDHVLINIDDDGDGSPDDPKDFYKSSAEYALAADGVKKTDADYQTKYDAAYEAAKEDYETTVVNMMRAIYTEVNAMHASGEFAENMTIKEIVEYIKEQYAADAELTTTEAGYAGKSWKDFTESPSGKYYNFLITVENLGDIDQDSVSNFVTDFKDYVINVYKACSSDGTTSSSTSSSSEYKYGKFYVYDADDSANTGNVTTADQITAENLCATEYGYHLLILNSWTKRTETDFTESDDKTGTQKDIQVMIYDDDEDDSNDIYVTIDSYNTETAKISFNQLFIYYCQNKMNQSTSLDSSISSLINILFSDAIKAYTSSNFQNYLYLNYLNIKVEGNETLATLMDYEKTFYANCVVSYNLISEGDDKSPFYDWVFGDLDWTRPDQNTL